jgi:hypothetical protein
MAAQLAASQEGLISVRKEVKFYTIFCIVYLTVKYDTTM